MQCFTTNIVKKANPINWFKKFHLFNPPDKKEQQQFVDYRQKNTIRQYKRETFLTGRESTSLLF